MNKESPGGLRPFTYEEQILFEILRKLDEEDLQKILHEAERLYKEQYVTH